MLCFWKSRQQAGPPRHGAGGPGAPTPAPRRGANSLGAVTVTWGNPQCSAPYIPVSVLIKQSNTLKGLRLREAKWVLWASMYQKVSKTRPPWEHGARATFVPI